MILLYPPTYMYIHTHTCDNMQCVSRHGAPGYMYMDDKQAESIEDTDNVMYNNKQQDTNNTDKTMIKLNPDDHK